MRAFNNEEEERLSSTVNSFIAVVKDIRGVMKQIDKYVVSSNEDELGNVVRKSEELVEKEKQKQSQLEQMQPELDSIVKAVDDQQRHKKNLKENIELIASGQRIEELQKEITKLEYDATNVEGRDTCYDDMEGLGKRKQEIMNAVARLEGRRGEILESIRSLKVSSKGLKYEFNDWSCDQRVPHHAAALISFLAAQTVGT
jgi:DNA repair protein RAD50